MAKHRFTLLRGIHTEGRAADTAALKSNNQILANIEEQLKDKTLDKEAREVLLKQKADIERVNKTLKPRRIYTTGEIIETDTNLLDLNGPYPMPGKYAKADGQGLAVAAMDPPPFEAEEVRRDNEPKDTLDTLDLQELKKVALAEGIDLQGRTKREDIVRVIREAMQLV